MVNCILIADSGSTKTDWILTSTENGIFEAHTTGINPVRDSQNAIFHILKDELIPQIPATCKITEIHFYGAGCINPFKQSITSSLKEVFKADVIEVESDLLGAARALCGDCEGIAGILGTGSNSCYYDGKQIALNTPPLGFILGDEGSGAVLGRTLVGNLLKGVFSNELKIAFESRFHLTQADIIERVYRKEQPNKFLASLVPFIADNKENAEIHKMLTDAFRLYLSRNVKTYQRPDLAVNLVGSIAFVFEKELKEAAVLEGLRIGKVLKKPIYEMSLFHKMHM